MILNSDFLIKYINDCYKCYNIKDISKDDIKTLVFNFILKYQEEYEEFSEDDILYDTKNIIWEIHNYIIEDYLEKNFNSYPSLIQHINDSNNIEKMKKIIYDISERFRKYQEKYIEKHLFPKARFKHPNVIYMVISKFEFESILNQIIEIINETKEYNNLNYDFNKKILLFAIIKILKKQK